MLQFMGLQTIQHDLATEQEQQSEARREAWNDNPSEPSEATNSADTLISEFWRLEL